jgi:hypothetical protein
MSFKQSTLTSPQSAPQKTDLIALHRVLLDEL